MLWEAGWETLKQSVGRGALGWGGWFCQGLCSWYAQRWTFRALSSQSTHRLPGCPHRGTWTFRQVCTSGLFCSFPTALLSPEQGRREQCPTQSQPSPTKREHGYEMQGRMRNHYTLPSRGAPDSHSEWPIAAANITLGHCWLTAFLWALPQLACALFCSGPRWPRSSVQVRWVASERNRDVVSTYLSQCQCFGVWFPPQALACDVGIRAWNAKALSQKLPGRVNKRKILWAKKFGKRCMPHAPLGVPETALARPHLLGLESSSLAKMPSLPQPLVWNYGLRTKDEWIKYLNAVTNLVVLSL